MSRKSKTVSIANDETLELAGFQAVDGGWYAPDDTHYEAFLSTEDAYAMYTRNAGDKATVKRRPAENRASSELVAITRRVCQAYSINFEKPGVWGDAEISLKKVSASVLSAWANSKYAVEGSTAPTELMVKNAVNSLKRLGEIEGTKKGYFRASAQASIDWSKFL